MPRRSRPQPKYSRINKYRSRAALLSLIGHFGTELPSHLAQAVCHAMWDATWQAAWEEPTEQFRPFLRSEPISAAVLAQSHLISRVCIESTAAYLLFSELALAQAGDGRVYPTGCAAWNAAVDRCDGELVAALRTVLDTKLVRDLDHPAVHAYLALRQGEAPSRLRAAERVNLSCKLRVLQLQRMDRKLFAKALGARVAEVRAARIGALAANNPEPARALARPAELRTCRVCGLCFASRRRLFRHLKSSTACVD